MFKDPIVEELRDNAARQFESLGADVHKIAEQLRREQEKHPHRIARRDTRTRQRKDPENQG